MIRLFHEIKIDWLGKRRFFIGLSIVLMLAGMGTALYRHKFHPNGTDAFNLGVDFKGGTVVTVRFKQPPAVEATACGNQCRGSYTTRLFSQSSTSRRHVSD